MKSVFTLFKVFSNHIHGESYVPTAMLTSSLPAQPVQRASRGCTLAPPQDAQARETLRNGTQRAERFIVSCQKSTEKVPLPYFFIKCFCNVTV